MSFELAAILISFAVLALCGVTVLKTLDETFKANTRLLNESTINARRADFWAREASETSKDLMSAMEDNAERRHANLELNYKIAKMEAEK